MKLTIMGLDTLQVFLPAQMLAVDVAHVGNKESIFVARLASVLVNVLYALLQGTADHGLGHGLSIVAFVEAGVICFQRQGSIFLNGRGDSRRCHNHADRRRSKARDRDLTN